MSNTVEIGDHEVAVKYEVSGDATLDAMRFVQAAIRNLPLDEQRAVIAYFHAKLNKPNPASQSTSITDNKRSE